LADSNTRLEVIPAAIDSKLSGLLMRTVTTENVSLCMLMSRAGQFSGDYRALASITPRIAKKTDLTPRDL
jgi:hypothetical protein